MTTGFAALKILVIDNNPQMRTIITTVIEAIGVKDTYCAQDGREGLARLLRYPIDIIYVDFEMRPVNGLSFIRSVRALNTAKAEIPIIMLTAYGDSRSVILARDAGMTEFLVKPVTAASILGRLNAVIMHPRAFIRSPNYTGPDRRRRALPYAGPERRSQAGLGAAANADGG